MAAVNSLLIDHRSIGLLPRAVPWAATVVAATSNCIENSVLDSLMLVLYIETAGRGRRICCSMFKLRIKHTLIRITRVSLISHL